jgi:hypothetical protein
MAIQLPTSLSTWFVEILHFDLIGCKKLRFYVLFQILIFAAIGVLAVLPFLLALIGPFLSLLVVILEIALIAYIVKFLLNV